jgi:hypothetical protein
MVPGDEQDPKFQQQLQEALKNTDPKELLKQAKGTPASREELAERLRQAREVARKPTPPIVQAWFLLWCQIHAPQDVLLKGKEALASWMQTNGYWVREPEPGLYQIGQRLKVLATLRLKHD